MMIEVKSITLSISYAADKLYLELNLPPAIWPFDHNPKAMMEITKGQGIQYCKDNFPNLELKVIKE